MIIKLGPIDEVHEMEPKLEHRNIPRVGDICKLNFDADHVVTKNGFLVHVYDDSLLTIRKTPGSLLKDVG